MSGRLSGKFAVVTGAGQGLGEAIAVRFAQEGAAGVVVNDLNAETAGRTAELVKQAGSRALAIAGSVTEETFVAELMERAVKEMGSVDVLVNNAGITRDKLMKDMTAADFDAVLNLNLRATFLCCKYGTPSMVAKKWGRVINMSSRAHLGNKGQTNYSASKAGVIGLTRALSLELGRFGVTVNAIAPGYIDTEMVAAVPENVLEKIVARIPVGRLGHAEEIARAVSFLASEDGGFITGSTMSINGGQHMY